MALPTVDGFLDGFMRPLVAGGPVHVGAPYDLGDLDRFVSQLDDQGVAREAVDDARALVLASHLARPPTLLLDRDELALAIAVHNALFLIHPDADGPLKTKRARRRVADVSLLVAARPRCETAAVAWARHGLLHNLGHLFRRDIELRWWSGRARFEGQPTPARLRAWPALRNVREAVETRGFDDLFAVPAVGPIIAAVLRRSPLTSLLMAHGPHVAWDEAAFLLRDAPTVRALVAALMGPDGDRLLPRLADSYDQLLERAPTPDVVRAVTALLMHLHVLWCGGGPRTVTLPRTLAALPAALREVAPALARPVVVQHDVGLAAAWGGYVDGLGAAADPRLASRLARQLGAGMI